MSLHLVEISARVSPGKHCVLLVDQAGWHISERLAVPSNITIVPLPAKCPELNPVENVWQFMRDKLAVQPRVPLRPRNPMPNVPRSTHEALLRSMITRSKASIPVQLVVGRCMTGS